MTTDGEAFKVLFGEQEEAAVNEISNAIYTVYNKFGACRTYEVIDQWKEMQRLEVIDLFEKLMKECGTTEVQRHLNELADKYGMR